MSSTPFGGGPAVSSAAGDKSFSVKSSTRNSGVGVLNIIKGSSSSKPKTKLQMQFDSVMSGFISTLSDISQMGAEISLGDDYIRVGIEELGMHIDQERSKLLDLDHSLGQLRSQTAFLLSRKTDSSRQIIAANKMVEEINQSNMETLESVVGSQALDQESETNRRKFAASSRNLVRKMGLVKERASLLEEINNDPINGQKMLLRRVLDQYVKADAFQKVSSRITKKIDLVSDRVPYRCRTKPPSGRSTYGLDSSPLKATKKNNRLRPIDIESKRQPLTVPQMKASKSSVSHWRSIESSLKQLKNQDVKIDRFNTSSVKCASYEVSQDSYKEFGQRRVASRSLLMSPRARIPTNPTRENSLVVSNRVSIFSPPSKPKPRIGWDQPSTIDTNRVTQLSLVTPRELKQTTLSDSSRETLASFGTTPEKLKAAIEIKKNESTSIPVSTVKVRSKNEQTKRSTGGTAALPPLSSKAPSNPFSNPAGKKRETVTSLPSRTNSTQKSTPSSAPLPPLPKQAPKNPVAKSSISSSTSVQKPSEAKSSPFTQAGKVESTKKESHASTFGNMKGLRESSLFASESSTTDGKQMPSFGASKPASAPNPTETGEQKDYKAILTSFYQKYNASKIGEVDKTLQKYKGREQEMFQKLSAKYKVPNPVQVSSTGSSSTPTLTSGVSSSSTGFGNLGSTTAVGAPAASTGFGNNRSMMSTSPFSSSGINNQQKSNSKAFGNSTTSSGLFGTNVGSNANSKSTMFGTTAQPTFGASNPPAPATPFGSSQAPAQSAFGNITPGSNNATPFGGTRGLSSASPFGNATAPTPFGAPSSSPVQPNTQRLFKGKTARDLLYQFYQEKNPSKLSEVDKVLAKYSGQEEQMFRNLAKKYQLDPSVFGINAAAPTPGFGSPSGTPGFGQTSAMGGGTSPFGQSSAGFGQQSQLGGGGISATNPPGAGATFGSSGTSGFGASGFGSLAQSSNLSPFGGQSTGFGAAPPAFGNATPFGAPRR